MCHASISPTLNTYSHAIPEMHEQAAEQVANAFLRGSSLEVEATRHTNQTTETRNPRLLTWGFLVSEDFAA